MWTTKLMFSISSGVVASILLVSTGLDCPGVNFAEACATRLRYHLLVAWSFMCNNYYSFMNLKLFYNICGTHILHV